MPIVRGCHPESVHLKGTLVLVAVLAVVLGGGLLAQTLRGDNINYHDSLVRYLRAYQRKDADGMRREMCSMAKKRLGRKVTSWSEVFARESSRLGGARSIEPLRGDQHHAVIEIAENRRLQLPLRHEGGRLLMCPRGTHLLGEVDS